MSISRSGNPESQNDRNGEENGPDNSKTHRTWYRECCPWYLSSISSLLENFREVCKRITNPSKNRRSDWGHQLRWGERERAIRIMFQNMGVMGNVSDQSSQHKIDTLEKL